MVLYHSFQFYFRSLGQSALSPTTGGLLAFNSILDLYLQRSPYQKPSSLELSFNSILDLL